MAGVRLVFGQPRFVLDSATRNGSLTRNDDQGQGGSSLLYCGKEIRMHECCLAAAVAQEIADLVGLAVPIDRHRVRAGQCDARTDFQELDRVGQDDCDVVAAGNAEGLETGTYPRRARLNLVV